MSDATLAMPAAPRAARPRHARLIIAAMLISTFMAAVEVTVISTAMPVIVSKLGGFHLFAWAFGIYLLAQAVMTPLYGRIADSFGRKPVYLASTSLFLVGSLLCGCAHSMVTLIVFRAIQGIGGGGLAPLGTTIIGDVCAPEDRPRIMGYVSGVWGIAAIAGPMLGAFFVHTLGWQFCFWVNLPVGLVTMTMVWRFLRDSAQTRSRAPIDLAGCVLLVAGLGLMMAALIQCEALPTAQLVLLLAVAFVALAGFGLRERQVRHPLLPLHLMFRPLLITANLSSLLAGTLLIGMTAFLPPLIQGVMGRDALDAGIVIGVLSVSWTIASMTIGRVVGRVPNRVLAVGAGIAMTIGMAVLVPIADGRSLGWLTLIVIPIGIGMGLTSIVFTLAVQGSVPAHERGRSIALFFFSRLMGQALGAAAFGGVLNAGLADTHGHDLMQALVNPRLRAALSPAHLAAATTRLDQALHGVFVLAAVLALAALAVACFTPRRAEQNP
ncbi:MFS transporter [Acidisoma cellulosilytica]|uniref:MFS transporter n=1 Tax=Acidisoma cellulosilyticum TaxID=2802395 RepID=A0A963Z633_9PROT|nr:MFS transporter [Acidisoma cellulosilyticum]MCB8883239.1 MFS transporter [Acidisoma cellulosilyticum]